MFAAGDALIKTDGNNKHRFVRVVYCAHAVLRRLQSHASVFPPWIPPHRAPMTLQDIAFAYHIMFLAVFGKVWSWHWTPAAANLPGAHGFGFFFRYLTFCSFTLQVVQLILCVAARVSKVVMKPRLCWFAHQHLCTPQSDKARLRLMAWADDISCALFGLAHAVTLLYHVIHSATQDVVEGGPVDRPPWLGFSVHILNTIFAWGDLLLAAPRSFSRRSSWLCTAITISYCLWLLLIRSVTGGFPYPFLNKLPFPSGFVGIMVGGIVIFRVAFEGGRGVAWLAQHWK